MKRQVQQKNTSWEKVSKWYSDKTKDGGHYYHQQVILKKLTPLLGLSPTSNVLDLGCGTGVLAHVVPNEARYTGIDNSPSLIQSARAWDKSPRHSYVVADATSSFAAPTNCTHACFLLSLQNMKDPAAAIQNAAQHLINGGALIIVLNHPAFRIPRQSSWEIDPNNKLQYRKINRYLSPLEIPITMHPGQSDSPVTWSYHYPISAYTKFLNDAGFVIEALEEWTSDKESVGKAARMENRAREEFPMFLAIRAVKK
jgi:SAM-dependent methyltransferase